MMNWLWPQFETTEAAKKALHGGAGVAFFAVILYGAEQYFMMQTTGFHFSIVPIFVMLTFVNAVGGAFAYHELTRPGDCCRAKAGPEISLH